MSTATALAGTFNADPVHSSFGFAVKYQNVSLFRGTLDEVAATLVDGKLDGAAKVESISIRTPEQFRAHVLSADFFDVSNHPQVKFVADDVQWAHIDIAAPAYNTGGPWGYTPKGGTGVPTRTMFAALEDIARNG